MRILLTSTGLETTEIKDYFVNMVGKDMNLVKALFIPTAATDAGAIAVLPKCMNDLLKCGIQDKNIKVFVQNSNTKGNVFNYVLLLLFFLPDISWPFLYHFLFV